MSTAEIIAIGTELLLGETLDTNTREIALALRSVGVDLYRATIVGDNVERISEVIRESLHRADIVITTGGLGPTVDDPTREAAAAALGLENEFQPDLWQEIVQKFNQWGKVPSENNRRQAFLPSGAQAIKNDYGTAPAFVVETGNSALISLPGVPSEVKNLLESQVLPFLKEHYSTGEVILTKNVQTAGIGESQVDDLLDKFERLENPTVGLAAKERGVDVRITAKAGSHQKALEMIAYQESQIREILADWLLD